MTEDEAKTKRCPQTFQQLVKANLAGGDVLLSSKCCASDCMVWRWLYGYKVIRGDKYYETILPQGYCGLAGRPEVLP